MAEATGWRANLPTLSASALTPEQNTNVTQNAAHDFAQTDMIAATAARYMDELSAAGTDNAKPSDDLPCEYLGAAGCTFPTDLRPFGCTTYICKYMYARLDRPTLTRIKRLVRELEDKHTILLRRVRQEDTR